MGSAASRCSSTCQPGNGTNRVPKNSHAGAAATVAATVDVGVTLEVEVAFEAGAAGEGQAVQRTSARRRTRLELARLRISVRDVERGVDRLHAERDLVLGHVEWWRDEQHVPAVEDVHVALHERVPDRGLQLRRRTVPALEHLLRATVLHELDADE